MDSNETAAAAPPPPALQARRLLRGAVSAALATAQRDTSGWPLPSLVLVAADLDATPLLLISALAEHSRNLADEPRCGLLIDGTAGHPDLLTGPRLSLLGRAEKLQPGTDEDRRLRARFVARHPSAALYAGFGDFALWRLVPERGHLVAGFGRIQWIEGTDLTLPAGAELREREDDIRRHLNEDHGSAMDLCAERLLGAAGRGWQVTGIDPEGCDLRLDAQVLRLSFDAPVATADGVREALIALIGRARKG